MIGLERMFELDLPENAPVTWFFKVELVRGPPIPMPKFTEGRVNVLAAGVTEETEMEEAAAGDSC